mmetsp:Transcript_73607/g.159251  ORF Transcript_73607/g.159251 Transcript_73607/m.159251 type:complete len:410 (-) Transcript_73607:66-1295(-)|eukprot:CAMPEP_0170594756 /NCGR_PEP_ID=MMETSP0224-20130122/14175_1 /TAXON_ID=285029 /ORGANISM="Togula jolla, Strain CCCM 725" /LENGTH=409 /DNA_ID=CAMNT_0010918845 /DNA_START=77 /DNA_END=1306 /DNA_ORIENTATION=-
MAFEEGGPFRSKNSMEHAQSLFGNDVTSKNQKRNNVRDSMAYDGHMMVGWRTFLIHSGTVWSDMRLWWIMGRLLLVVAVIAPITFFCEWDPSGLRVSEFRTFATYLNVFVAFLLGLFMNISLNRWLECVDGFMVLVQAVRNLQIQLASLGVQREKALVILRFGIISVRCLSHQVRGMEHYDTGEKEDLRDAMFKDLSTIGDDMSMLTMKEVEMLKTVADPAGLLWIWVGSYLGRLAQDGHIPPMASPTYGRIMNLAQHAQEGLRKVRSTVMVQTPFMYVHTLSTVVHLNNFLSALSLGLTLGASAGVILTSREYHFIEVAGESKPGPVMKAFENIIISTLTCFVGPLLFQAFLIISVGVSMPFSNSKVDKGAEASIPTNRILRELYADIRDGNALSGNPPGWKQPCFKV